MSYGGIGDNAWIFESVTVKSQDAHERRLEGEEHTRLNLRSSRQTAGLRHDLEGGRAKVSKESREAGDMNFRRDHSIVIAGDREDRSRIVAVRFVELIVVVLHLAETIDHVAQQQIELRDFAWFTFLEITHHLVGDHVLGLRTASAAAITGGMEYDLTRARDLADRGCIRTQDLLKRQARFDTAAWRREWQRLNLVLAIELVNFLVGRIVGRMLDLEPLRVCSRHRLRKHRPTE